MPRGLPAVGGSDMEAGSRGSVLASDYPPIQGPDQFSSTSRRRLSGPGLRTFVRVAGLWRLSDEERRAVLGHPSSVDYHEWLDAARERRRLVLSVDVLVRISATLGIHQALGVLHRTDGDGISWLRGANRSVVFGGKAPMELVTSGLVEGLLTVQGVLDAMTSGNQAVGPNDVDQGFQPYTTEDLVVS